MGISLSIGIRALVGGNHLSISIRALTAGRLGRRFLLIAARSDGPHSMGIAWGKGKCVGGPVCPLSQLRSVSRCCLFREHLQSGAPRSLPAPPGRAPSWPAARGACGPRQGRVARPTLAGHLQRHPYTAATSSQTLTAFNGVAAATPVHTPVGAMGCMAPAPCQKLRSPWSPPAPPGIGARCWRKRCSRSRRSAPPLSLFMYLLGLPRNASAAQRSATTVPYDSIAFGH